MAVVPGDYGKASLQDLIDTARAHVAGDMRSVELKAELDRRVSLEQISAAKAQRQSACYQLWAVVAMFLTAIATAAVPWLMNFAHVSK